MSKVETCAAQRRAPWRDVLNETGLLKDAAAGCVHMPSKKEQYKYAKHAAPRRGAQAQLTKMDQQLVERMEWAFRTGREQLIVIGSPLSKSTPQS